MSQNYGCLGNLPFVRLISEAEIKPIPDYLLYKQSRMVRPGEVAGDKSGMRYYYWVTAYLQAQLPCHVPCSYPFRSLCAIVVIFLPGTRKKVAHRITGGKFSA